MRKLSRQEWVNGAFEALVEGGVDALRVEPLALRLGVTKGSFYHHFTNRRALHLAVLEEWERLGTGDIIDEVVGAAPDPVGQLRALAHRSMAPDPVSDAIENAIRGWAAHDDEVAAATQRVDDRRLSFAAKILRNSGLSPALAQRRAKLFYRVLIGEFLWRSSGGPAATKREIDETVTLLVGSD